MVAKKAVKPDGLVLVSAKLHKIALQFWRQEDAANCGGKLKPAFLIRKAWGQTDRILVMSVFCSWKVWVSVELFDLVVLLWTPSVLLPSGWLLITGFSFDVTVLEDAVQLWTTSRREQKVSWGGIFPCIGYWGLGFVFLVLVVLVKWAYLAAPEVTDSAAVDGQWLSPGV